MTDRQRFNMWSWLWLGMAAVILVAGRVDVMPFIIAALVYHVGAAILRAIENIE